MGCPFTLWFQGKKEEVDGKVEIYESNELVEGAMLCTNFKLVSV